MREQSRIAPTPRRLLGLGAAVLAVQTAVVVARRATHGGDFDITREFGRRFLAGEPLYGGGLHYPYMPAAAAYFAPLALLPAWLGFALRYLVALACLWATLRLLASLAAVPTARRAVLAGLTLALASHYVLRDLDDGGPHLILLAMLVAGLAAAARGRAWRAAAWFGLAAALKAPNALLLPFLLWKRQWRLARLTVAAIAFWTALPLAWMGPQAWWAQQRQWLETAVASAAGTPPPGARESEARLQNQALRPLVARLAASLHGAALDTTAPASRLPLGAALAVTALVAWWTRRPFDSAAPRQASWLAESSAVLILSLLLSPVTWVQHLVLVIPALYVIVARGDAARWPPPLVAALALYATLALALNREVLGRAAYLTLLSAGLHTWALLLLLAVLAATALRQPARVAAPHTGRDAASAASA